MARAVANDEMYPPDDPGDSGRIARFESRNEQNAGYPDSIVLTLPAE